MENLFIVAGQVAILFVLMGVGAVARWKKLIGEVAINGFVNLLILIVTPALIIDSFQRPFDPSMLRGLGLAFVIAVLGHFLAIGLAYAFVRPRDEDLRRPLRLAAVFSNAGFMGIPLEQALFGDVGVFYGVVYVAVFNLFIWSWGYCSMRGRTTSDERVSLMRMVVNPGTVGLALGLPLFLCSAKLPAMVAVPVHHLSNLNTPLAMVIIGYSLAGAKLNRVLRLPSVSIAAILRLVAYPILVVAAMYVCRGFLSRELALALTVSASAPVAAMVPMFAVKFDRNVDASVAIVSATTLLSIVTMPLVIAWAMTLF